MIGFQTKVQKNLFYKKSNLDQRIRKEHILPTINKQLKLKVIYNQVQIIYLCKNDFLKAEIRRGVVDLRASFERIFWQCVDASLVCGSKLFKDRWVIQTDTSNNSTFNKESLMLYLNKRYYRVPSWRGSTNADDDDDSNLDAATKSIFPQLIQILQLFALGIGYPKRLAPQNKTGAINFNQIQRPINFIWSLLFSGRQAG